jgi:hypothetical protein
MPRPSKPVARDVWLAPRWSTWLMYENALQTINPQSVLNVLYSRRVPKISNINNNDYHVCVSVGPSVCPYGTPPNHYTDFHETTRYLRVSWKSAKKIQVLLKCDKNNLYFTFTTRIFMKLIDVSEFHEYLPRKFEFYWNLTRIICTLHSLHGFSWN